MKMIKTLCSIFLVGFLATQINAQTDSTKNWTYGGIASFGFNQVSLTNWAAGGESSISGAALFSASANYEKGKHRWGNQLDLAFGLVQQGDITARKTDDRIEFTSKYGREIKENIMLTGLFNFRTQFAPGFQLPNDSVAISEFMAPAYIQTAIGLDYQKDKNFTLFLGPVAYRATIVNNQRLADAGAFGVKPGVKNDLGRYIIPGENVRHEFGGSLRMFFKKEVIENVTLQTQLQLFSNYLEEPQNVDVVWDVLIAMKVNKYITASITTNLIYDDDITIEDSDGNFGPRTQFKQVLAVGLAYNFGNAKK